jgi:hypothetical protein
MKHIITEDGFVYAVLEDFSLDTLTQIMEENDELLHSVQKSDSNEYWLIENLDDLIDDFHNDEVVICLPVCNLGDENYVYHDEDDEWGLFE